MSNTALKHSIELDLFGEVPEKIKRSYKRKKVSTNPFEGCKPDTIVVSRHVNDEKEYPGHLTLLTHDFDTKSGEVIFEWTENDVKDLWRGLLESHFSQLRQTKPGSRFRQEILDWQETADFKDLCDYLDFDAEQLKDGVILAMKAYDLTKAIGPLLDGDEEGCIEFLFANPQLTARDRNSLKFQDLVVAEVSSRLSRRSKQKRLEIMTLLSSDEVNECARIIGIDISNVRNKVRYFNFIEC